MHLERKGTQEVRVRLQGVGGDDLEAQLGGGHRGAARQSLRWAHAQRRARASGQAHRSEPGRDVRRQRLSRDEASSRKRQGLSLGPKTERPAETIATPALGNRARDWSLETRPPDDAKLPPWRRRRLHQRAAGRLGLQPEKTPESFLLAHFWLA